MTREEAIKRIQDHMRIHAEKEPRAIYITEALQMAIETMRKYQKIQKIINEYDTAWELHHMRSTIDKIREVIKNENDK